MIACVCVQYLITHVCSVLQIVVPAYIGILPIYFNTYVHQITVVNINVPVAS